MQNLYENILKILSKSTFISFILLTGCAQWIPGLTQAMDDYITDDAINVSIHKQAIQKETDVNVKVEIINQ